MARRVVETRTCDRCDFDGPGAEDATEVTISFSGKEAVLDLCAMHLAEVVGDAPVRKAGKGRTLKVTKVTSISSSPQAVRSWAKSNGITVSDRGRVPNWVTEQFETAQALRDGTFGV